MGTFLLHAGLGFAVALVVFVIAARISGERGFSLPSAPIFIGFLCGIGAHFLSPWATPAILLLYAIAAINEAREMRRALDEYARRNRDA